jgi:hypothetical protein
MARQQHQRVRWDRSPHTFWLAIAGLSFVMLMTRAPPGPFTPAPFGVAQALARRFGWLRS